MSFFKTKKAKENEKKLSKTKQVIIPQKQSPPQPCPVDLTLLYLKWDGACFPGKIQDDGSVTFWRNGSAEADAPPVASQKVIGELNPKQTEAILISVSHHFVPIEENAIIEIGISNIKDAGCLVLQVHDAENHLVYAERLTQKQIWGLPSSKLAADTSPSLKYSGTDSVLIKKDKHKKRREAQWGDPSLSPYKISLYLTTQICNDKKADAKIPLDCSSESGSIKKAKMVALDRGQAPIVCSKATDPYAGKSSVIINSVKPELLNWRSLYEEITVEAFPANPAGIAGDLGGLTASQKKILWAKCRLNEIGFHAGPLDTDKTHPDFEHAIRRYRVMRRIDDARTYKPSAGYVSTPKPKPIHWTDWEKLKTDLELDAILACLKREKVPANDAICHKRDKFFVEAFDDDKDPPVRLYIDSNRFYSSLDEFTEDKTQYDVEWLSRPCLPLRMKVLLEKRDGPASGSDGDGVYAPEVVAPVRFEWCWEALVEKLDPLPSEANCSGTSFRDLFNYSAASRKTYITSADKANYCSKTKDYVKAAYDEIAGSLPDPGSRFKAGCRKELGGIVEGDNNKNVPIVFAPFHNPDGSTAGLTISVGNIGDVFVATRGPDIYFRPSLIAGDSYQLNFGLDLTELTNKDSRKGELRALYPNRSPSWTGMTSRLTVWRRIRTARLINWPEQTLTWEGNAFSFDDVWRAVRKEYQCAFVELPENIVAMSARNVTLPLPGESCASVMNTIFSAAPWQAEAPIPLGREPISPFAFNENAFIHPSLRAYDLTVASGNLPRVVDIVQYVVLDLWNGVFRNLSGPWQSKADYDNVKREFLNAVWILAQKWGAYAAAGPKDPTTIVRTIGQKLYADLCCVFEPAAPAGIIDIVDLKMKWKPAADTTGDHFDAGKLRYDTSAAHDLDSLRIVEYGGVNFSKIMDLLFIPTDAKAELDNWKAGDMVSNTVAPTVKAVYDLVYFWSRQKGKFKPQANQQLLFDSTNHFFLWLKNQLVIRKGDFREPLLSKNVLIAKRDIAYCPIDAVAKERRKLQLTIGGMLSDITPRLAQGLDEIVRGGLLCPGGVDEYHDFADGLLIVNTKIHGAVNVAGTSNTPFGASMGCPHGLVMLSQLTPMEPYMLWAHEIGHTLYLQHFRNTTSYLVDHDLCDSNCMMSYPLLEAANLPSWDDLNDPAYELERRVVVGEGVEGRSVWPRVQQNIVDKENGGAEFKHVDRNALAKVMRTHFCGKCNLKIRGWNIRAKKSSGDFILPRSSQVWDTQSVWAGLRG
jgi:hypothetical protein